MVRFLVITSSLITCSLWFPCFVNVQNLQCICCCAVAWLLYEIPYLSTPILHLQSLCRGWTARTGTAFHWPSLFWERCAQLWWDKALSTQAEAHRHGSLKITEKLNDVDERRANLIGALLSSVQAARTDLPVFDLPYQPRVHFLTQNPKRPADKT